MSTVLTCPGVARGRHNGGCCAAFAALRPAQRAARGILTTRTAPVDERPVPPAPAAITLAELARLVAELQRRAEMDGYPHRPEPVSVWLEVAADEPLDQALALIEVGIPYGLVAGWRQLGAQT
jgi:hypothetical protein